MSFAIKIGPKACRHSPISTIGSTTLLTFLLTMSMGSLSAQNWIIDVTVDLQTSDCFLEDVTSASYSLNGAAALVATPSIVTASEAYFSLTGSGRTTSGSLNISVLGTCGGPPAFIASYGASLSASRVINFDLDLDQDCAALYFPAPVLAAGQSGLAVTIRFSSAQPFPDISGSPTGNKCGNQSISLNASTDYASYVWEYQLDNGLWNTLTNLTAKDNPDRTLQQLFGDEYQNFYSKTLAFRYRGTGSCRVSPSIGPYIFFPPAPQISDFSTTAPACPGGSNGSITITHESIAPNYAYIYNIAQLLNASNPTASCAIGSKVGFKEIWRTNSKNVTGATQVTLTSTDLLDSRLVFRTGWYQITVESQDAKDNKVSCPSDTTWVCIPEPPLMILSLSESTSPSCHGGGDGTATFTITNGVGPFRARADNSNLVGLPESPDRSITLNGLSAGSHTLYVADSCGTIKDVDFTVLPLPPIALTKEIGTTRANCLNNGSVSLEVTSIPNRTYTYYLNDIVYGSLSSSTILTGVWPGSYSLQVALNGCGPQTIPDVTVQVAGPSVLTNNLATAAGTSCSNSTDGQINLTGVTKQNGALWYRVTLTSPGHNDIVAGPFGNATASINNVPPGTYAVAVHDLCGTTDPATQTGLVVTAPNPISISERSNVDLACFDGTTSGLAPLTVTGGTNSFTLNALRNGVPMANYPVANATSPSISVNGLPLGSYTYQVTENCPVAGVVDASDQSAFTVSSAATSAVSATVTAPLKDSNGNGVLGQGDFHISCNGATDGVINVSVTGGVLRSSGTRYLLTLLNSGNNSTVSGVTITETGSTGANWLYTISGVGQGSYRVRVEDGNACQRIFPGVGVGLTAPAPLTITPPNVTLQSHFSGLVLYQSQLYVTCKGGTSGVFYAFVQGGNAPYTIRLYRRTSVAQPWPTNPTASASNVANGTAAFAGLGAGLYQVQVADQQNCSSTPQFFQILEAATPLQLSSVIPFTFAHGANTSCVGTSDGSIQLVASGGVGDYSFSMVSTSGFNSSVSKPGNTHTFSNLSAINGVGLPITYTYSLADQLGCQWQAGNPVPGNIQLTPPQPLQVIRQVTSRTAPLFEIPCRGDMATVRFTSHGGLYPHQVTIGTEIKIINSATDAVEFTLPSGDYTASFTDALNCTAPNQVFSLREPLTHIAAAMGEIQFPVCIGGEGMVDVLATGGVTSLPGQEYAFVIRRAELQEAATDTLRGLGQQFYLPASGFQSQAYVLTAVDALGCEDEQDFVMPVNPLPLSVSATSLVSPSCHGGTNGGISIQVEHPTFMDGGQLRLLLAGGHLGDEVVEEWVTGLSHTFQHLRGTDIDGHTPYRVWVEDNNHCVDTAFQYLPALLLPSPEPLHLELVRSTRPSCYNGRDGSILVEASGGVGGYELSFAGTPFDALPADHRTQRTALTAGSYEVSVRDANFQPDQPTCLLTSDFIVDTGRFLHLSAQGTSITCKDGSDGAIDLEVELENAAPGESIIPDRLAYFWTNSRGVGSFTSDQQDIVELNSGVYTVTVRYDMDTATCRQEKTIPLLEPFSAFQIAEVKTYPVRCGTTGTGSAWVGVTGGWPNRMSSYRIGEGPWVPFIGSHFLVTGLSAGVHHLEVSQADECVDVLEFEITNEAFSVEALLVQDPTCPQFSDAVLLLSSSLPDAAFAVDGSNFQDEPMFTNLAAGTHSMQARSKTNSSCLTEVAEVQITNPSDCEQPLTLQVAQFQPASCAMAANGSAKTLVAGGVTPYRFYWDGAEQEGASERSDLAFGLHCVRVVDAVDVVREATFSIEPNPALDFDYAVGLSSCPATCDGSIQIIVNRTEGRFLITWTGAARSGEITLDHSHIGNIETLCRGTYTVQVVDLNAPSCQVSKVIQVEGYPALQATVGDVKPPTCFGGTDGQGAVNIVGGSGHYAVAWNNNQSGTRVTSLAAGLYVASITDTQLGCATSVELNIPDAGKIEVLSEKVTMPTCHGRSDGRAELTFTNVTNPLVKWADNKIGAQVGGLRAGVHVYRVTSSSGCIFESSVVVPEPDKLVGIATTVGPSCNQSADGEIALQLSGGTAPYSVFWGGGQRQARLRGLRKGDFSYRAVDRNGCTTASVVSVSAPEPLALQAVQLIDVSCNGGTDGLIEVAASGGVAPYIYGWSPTQAGALNAGLKKGRYAVTLLDQHHCVHGAAYSISEPPTLRVEPGNMVSPSCASTLDGSISVAVAGGVAPYSIHWNNDKVGTLLPAIGAGYYSVDVQDANGCDASRSFTLAAPSPLEIVNMSVTQPSCFQYADGRLSFDVIGGTLPLNLSWQHGPTTNLLPALRAGVYEVDVRDANNCIVAQSFKLVDPPEVVITDIAAETLVCTGTVALFESHGHWIRYQWTSPAGVNSVEPRYETSEPGIHRLTTWDERNCPATISFSLAVSDQPISPDFLRLSEPVIFEPVVFVDITHPIPTSSEWILPDDPDLVVNRLESGRMELVFTRTGNFDIGLRSWLGDCKSDLTKVVVVKDTPPPAPSGRTSEEPIGISVLVHPAPATEELFLSILHCTVDPLGIEVVSPVDDRVVFSRQLVGHTEYELAWDVRTWQPGVYFLIYRQGKESGSVRLLIAR